MINTVLIKDIDGVMNLVFDQPLDERNNRHRGYYLYRGLSDVSFKLLTSLQRNCGEQSVFLENNILNNFIKYTAIDSGSDYDNIWRSMILGQHHGLPTRLLDWTHSPLVGLHFAVSDNLSELDKRDCVVWRIDIEKLHDLLPKEFHDVMVKKNAVARVFSVDMLNKVVDSIENYDQLVSDKSMVVLEPPSLDPRIVNQYAFFTVVPRGITDIEKFFETSSLEATKYIIDAKLKWRIRDFLDEANISERTIYPGLDGICKWLARHYYVKGD